MLYTSVTVATVSFNYLLTTQKYNNNNNNACYLSAMLMMSVWGVSSLDDNKDEATDKRMCVRESITSPVLYSC